MFFLSADRRSAITSNTSAKVRHWWSVGAVAGLVSIGVAQSARGGAFEVPMQAARAASEADAFVAQADDPSAIFYNPAGLTQLKGTNISTGGLGIFPDFRYVSPRGDENMTLPTLLPHVYAESDLGLQQWRVGVGVDNTFGINEDYGNRGPLNLVTNQAQLAIINVEPTVAYQVNPNLSLGVGLNLYYGSLQTTRNVFLGAGAPEGDFHFRGNDFAVGVTPSVLWKIDDKNSIGAYYRSPVSFDFKGRGNIKVDGSTVVGPSRVSESSEMPQAIVLGYAYRPMPVWTIEGDVEWTDWHITRQLAASSPNPAFNGQNTPLDYKSGFTYRIGTEYRLTPHWAIRGGYSFSQNATPTDTYSPLVPDSNQNLFAVGVGYSRDNWSLDLAYDFILRQTRQISGDVIPLVDGTWENHIQTVMLTYTMKL